MSSDWTVLLVVGPAAVGKTSAAKRISVVRLIVSGAVKTVEVGPGLLPSSV